MAASSSSSKRLPYSSDKVDETMRWPELGIISDHQPFTFGTGLVLAETTTTPLFSESQIENQQAMIPLSPESTELLARLDFYDILGPADPSEPFFEPSPPPRRYRHVSRDDDDDDVFFDDFPADMFDPVPSP